MKTIKTFLPIICLSLTWGLSSCTDSKTDTGSIYTTEQKTFLNQVEYGTYPNGINGVLFPYSDSQTAFNATALKSRVQKDNMSAYIQYTLAQVPVAGNEVSTTITSSGVTIVNKSGLFKALKKENHRLWLWDEGKRIGHLIYWE